MELPSDPYMLLSVINMKLRDGDYASFDEMCKALDLDSTHILETLRDAGFEYLAAPVNQFR